MNEPSVISWVTQHWDEILFALFAVCTAASAIVKLTPSQTDDLWVARIRAFLERLALNAPRTRPPGIYADPSPPAPEQLAPPPQGNQLATSTTAPGVPGTKPQPPEAFRQWPTDKRPPGTLGLLLLVMAASALSACAPAGHPTSLTPEAVAQIAVACREAANTIRDAADRRSEGILPEAVTPVVDRLVMVSRRPCSAQAQALPSDLDRIETATQAAQEALANG
jgi:hypothetical protein